MTHDDVAPHDAPSPAALIGSGAAHLGIELGSTRIKAALVDDAGTVLATGSHAWENRLEDGSWTYSLEDVHAGLQSCYADLARRVREEHGTELAQVRSLGVSAMMHGYLALDAEGALLTPFRTWRNTYTGEAAGILSELLGRNIPLRWSIAHLLHAARGGEDHVSRIAALTTLAGYVHERLSGRRVLGVGDASGMFPISADGRGWDAERLAKAQALPELEAIGRPLTEILPEILVAGEDAGTLTEDGARLLDPSGTLRPGAVLAAPEGDAGTGMVATSAIAPRTGNVSAGTSAFAMVVLEGELSAPREEVDLVTTPAGDPVAMIHTNNCTGDLDAWLRVLAEFSALIGAAKDPGELYAPLFELALQGEADAGGLISYNYLSGEHQTGVESGRPMLVRSQEARFTLPNLLRAHLYGAFGALATGMRILLEEEKVRLDTLYAHGGIFSTKGVAQQILADALRTPVAVDDSAGEGGAWGMALLAAYTAERAAGSTASLDEHLRTRIFAHRSTQTAAPDPVGAEGYARWLDAYRAALPVQRLAGDLIPDKETR